MTTFAEEVALPITIETLLNQFLIQEVTARCLDRYLRDLPLLRKITCTGLDFSTSSAA